VNIAERIVQNHDFKETERIYCGKPVLGHNGILLVHIDVDGIYAKDLDRDFHVETIIFASRHSSESGQRSLTVHTTGNTTNSALYGGRPKSLAWVDPQRMKAALLTLKEKAQESGLDGYTVSLEATHHGPTDLEVPVMFVEIGSSQEQWKDRLAAEAVASAIYSAATTQHVGKPSVGFGGGHYSAKHTEVDITQDFAIGHILPKYFFDQFTPEIVELTFKRTVGNCRTAIIDWKGIRGGHRSALIEVLESNKVEVVKI
jgi:D-aminoacyl-tRNA deacylase